MMKPGAYQINETDYHQNPEFDAIHSGDFKHMQISMAHFIANRQAPPQKDIFNMGQLFHFSVLEPEKFSKKVAVFNGIRRGKKWNEFQEQNADKVIIKPPEYDHIMRMTEAVDNHPLARAIINHKAAVIEESIFWYDPLSGEACKCRPDIRIESEGVIADLKGVLSAEKKAFSKACANNGYFFQAPFYLDGATEAIADHSTFLFIAVEKEPPHGVAIYEADQQFLETGRMQYKELLLKYSQCKAENKWPCYPEDIQTLSLPKWATYIDLEDI